MNIFKLFGTVVLDGAGKVEGQLTAIDKKGARTGKSFAALGKAAKGLAIGVTAVAASLGVMLNKTAKATDRIDKMSQKIGLSRKAFQEYDFILSQYGASVDGLQMSMKTLSVAVQEAENGNRTYQGYLKRLGVVTRDVNGNIKSQEKLFNETFTALANVSDETERTAIASRLLGDAATDLAPAFNAGAGEIERLRKEAHSLGLVLNDEVVDAGVNYTDMVDKTKRALSSLMIKVITPLMPLITNTVIPGIEKFIDNFLLMAMSLKMIFQVTAAVIKKVATDIKDSLVAPLKAVQDFLDKVAELFGFEGMGDMVYTTWVWTLEKSKELIAFLTSDDSPKEKFKTAWEWTVDKVGEGWDFLTDTVFPKVAKTIASTWDLTLAVVGDLVEKLIKGTSTGEWGEFLTETIGSDKIKLPVVLFFTGIGDLMTSIKDAFTDATWKDFVSWTATGIQLIIGAKIVFSAIAATDISLKIGGIITALWALASKAWQVLSGTKNFVPADSKGGLGVLMAVLSLGISLGDAIITGDWAKLAANVGAALISAFAAGVITGNPALGLMAFNIALNFHFGEWIGKGFNKVIDKFSGTKIKEIGSAVEGKAPSDDYMFGEYIDNVNAAFANAGENSSSAYWGAFKAGFAGVGSITGNIIRLFIPNKEAEQEAAKADGIEIGVNLGDGLIEGLDSPEFEAENKGFWNRFLQKTKDILGIHSPSVLTEDMGDNLMEGLLIGIENGEISILEAFKQLIKMVSDVWAKSKIPAVVTTLTVSVTTKVEEVTRTLWGMLTGYAISAWDTIKSVSVSTWNIMKDMGKGIAEFFVNVFTHPLKALEDLLMGALDGLGKFASTTWAIVGGVAKGLAGAVVGSSSILSGAAAGWESARGEDKVDEDGNVTEKGKVDFAGGVSGILMSLLSSSAPFQEMMEKLAPLIQMVADFFGQLITPLMPLVDILADLLPTILQSLMPIMEAFIWMIEKVIVPVVGFLSNLITSIYDGVVDIVNWIIGFLNKIPFVNISWRMKKSDNTGISPATSSDSTKEASSKGGTQLSEITGPTRDLLSDLLSPLASLNTLTGTTNRIYDLLEDRLGNGMGNSGLVIQNVTVNTNGVDGRKLGTDFMDAVEAELSRRGSWNARGYANA